MRVAGTVFLYCVTIFMFGQASYSAYFQHLPPSAWIGNIVGGLALLVVTWKTRNL